MKTKTNLELAIERETNKHIKKKIKDVAIRNLLFITAGMGLAVLLTDYMDTKTKYKAFPENIQIYKEDVNKDGFNDLILEYPYKHNQCEEKIYIYDKAFDGYFPEEKR